MKRLRNIQRLELPQGPPKWVPILGELQKTLQRGEYLPLRPLPMFESNFVQVTNRGGPVFLHHRTNRLTMGVAASLPGLVLPDILLIAQPSQGRDSSNLVLTRMIPLDLVHLYVHDLSTWRLKLRLVTGRYYYLELDAPGHEVGFLFDRWIRLINLLREPATTWAPRTLHTPPLDLSLASAPASTWHLQNQCYSGHTETVTGPTFPYKTVTSQKQKKAKALKRRFKSQAVGDSVPLIWSQLEHADFQKKSVEKRSLPDAREDRSQTQIHVSEKASITIRTIFSIISNTVNPAQSSQKAGSPDSQRASKQQRLLDTPSRCVLGDSTVFPFPGSYDHLDMLLWQQDIGELMDPESSTLSSSSLGTAPGPPATHLCPSYSPFPRPSGKARPASSRKAPSAPVTPWKTPFIVDQSQRVPVLPAAPRKAPAPHAPFRKVSAAPALSQKASMAPTVSQRAAAVPAPRRKTPLGCLPHRAPAIRRGMSPKKALAVPAPPAQQAPSSSLAPAVPQRAGTPPPPAREASPQKAVSAPPQDQGAPDAHAAWGAPPEDAALLPTGVPGQALQEGAQPAVLVGAQVTDVVEMRAQATTLELPFTTTKKQSKEFLVTKTREVALEGLRGRGKFEDRAHQAKEETVVELPGLKSKEVEQHKKWVKTRELAVEGPRQEHNRPFSVEGLALAKLMIMASSKEQHLRPAVASMPSWLSVTSQASALPFSSSQLSLLERTPVVVREQVEVHAWGRECMPRGADRAEPSKGPPQPASTPNSPRMTASSQIPIPLPATRWEDLPQPPLLAPPPTRADTMSEAPQHRPRKPHDPRRAPKPPPLAKMGSSSKILLPVLLEMERMREKEAKKGAVPKEDLRPSASTKRSLRFE
ncbi:Golgi-associated RAB2 interactor protein 5B isoform X1 [Oryctolagus cuniculus]|uniref:Golgi-associated RAB2 interactor protein 5B isoform X1 n=1 Tax=Oryctolagus cuniculus TaxID=9986 RepID=UPI003878FFEB